MDVVALPQENTPFPLLPNARLEGATKEVKGVTLKEERSTNNLSTIKSRLNPWCVKLVPRGDLEGRLAECEQHRVCIAKEYVLVAAKYQGTPVKIVKRRCKAILGVESNIPILQNSHLCFFYPDLGDTLAVEERLDEGVRVGLRQVHVLHYRCYD